MNDKNIKLCGCGCGEPVTQRRDGTYNDFINHHYIRINNPAKNPEFIEKMTGENNPAKRPEVREKISKNLKGVYVGEKNHMKQEKYRKMFSEKFMGEGNPRYGKKASEETRQKMSESQRKRQPMPTEFYKKIGEKLKNRPKSEEHKKKISETFKKEKIVDGENNPFYGKRHSDETRKIISKCKKKKNGMNENHPLWEKFMSSLSQTIRHYGDYTLWKNNVLKRDNYICQDCGKRGGNMNIHHKNKSFSDILIQNNITSLEDAIKCQELWDIENGITLCEDCHYSLHYKKYKKKQ